MMIMVMMMMVFFALKKKKLSRRKHVPWRADTWCTVYGSPLGCFPSWWRGASRSPWTQRPGRGPCHSRLGAHSTVGWCLGANQTLSERQFPWKKYLKRRWKVETSPECPLSVCSVAKCVKYFLHGNNRWRFAVGCFPNNTVGALHMYNVYVLCCEANSWRFMTIMYTSYVVRWIHDDSHLAEPSSNLILFANVAVNVRWASIVVWHLNIMMMTWSSLLFVIVTITS